MMQALVTTNYFIATGGILLAFVGIILLIDSLRGNYLEKHIRQHGLYVAGLLIFVSTAMALVYSEVFGLVPCGLCWLERIFLFPQLILIAVAFYYKDTAFPRYGIALSVLGFTISLYHHIIQMTGNELVPCLASSGDCTRRYLFEYGFMTLPLLGAITFGFLIILYMYILRTYRIQN
jgi:disulfide bond formation protein DsbB